jgi:hypothetical protein
MKNEYSLIHDGLKGIPMDSKHLIMLTSLMDNDGLLAFKKFHKKSSNKSKGYLSQVSTKKIINSMQRNDIKKACTDVRLILYRSFSPDFQDV